jgi:ATP-dependent DNA helicase RecQ
LSQDTESVGVTAWQPEQLNLARQEINGHITKVSEWSQQLKKLFNLQ